MRGKKVKELRRYMKKNGLPRATYQRAKKEYNKKSL